MMADGVVVVDGMKFVIDTETNQVSLTSVEIGVDSLFIPEKIMFEGKEYAVTTLVNHDWSGVRFVEVPSSLKSLPKGCFSYEEDLVGVKFSSSLASLGSCCFEMCRNLRDVELPSSLTTLNDRCFNGCSSLESLDIPASVTSLGNMCFCDCSSLKSVILPSTVTSLGDACFLRCSNISEITIPASVTTLGNSCFGSCSKLQSVEIPSSVTSLGRSCFWCCSSLTEVVIPSSVTSLEDQTFYDCSNLIDVEIPSSVTSLGSSCFSYCTSLREITIPSTVVKFAAESPGYDYQGTFGNCSNLERIIIEDGDRLLTNSQGSKLFEGVNVKKLYWGREISDASFRDCKTLVDLTFGPKVRTIPSSCFQGCDGLTEVFIPDGVTDTGNSTFNNCANLKNLYVGNGVQMLCSIVGSCGKFENLYIGNGLRRIEYVSFLNCNSLKMICTTSSQIGYVREKCGIPTTLAMLCVPDKEMYAGILGAYNLKNIVTDVSGEAVYTGKGVDVDVLTSVPGCGVSLVSDAETKLPVNVGRYNAPLPVEISSGKWKSTFNTNCSFTIKPAPLTVIANSETREYGQDNPEWSCTYVGFVNNETEDVLTARPTVLCPATKESPVGQYQLIPSAASAKNYEITYERGVLNVTKASQQITWEQDIAKFHVGDIVELQAESSAGLKVKFASSNSSVADVYSSGGKTYMECMAPGTARITASQPGGENYNAADDLVKRVSVEIADGVAGVHAEEDIVEYYSMDGTLVASPTKGIYIVRYKDGQMRKVVLK